MDTRKKWIDQARGLSIFLVVYGHNFPVNEPYIYSFHVPLFFFIAGMFHPKKVTFDTVKRRAKMILIPYFVWALALYFFWFFLGRNYGDSAEAGLSAIDNLIGILYAQGGQGYMDWGIPMWFLPCIFIVFLAFAAIQRIQSKIFKNFLVLFIVLLGFIWPRLTSMHLPWSLDVALVSVGFYAVGGHLKSWLVKLSKLNTALLFILFFGIHFLTFYVNPQKVDMYRSIYGNEGLFFLSGLFGAIAYLLFFKIVPVFSFFAYLGRHTIVLLATHVRMLTVVKLVLMVIFGMTVFEFTEIEKLALAILQVLLVIPIIWLVNKYLPILDGKITKS